MEQLDVAGIVIGLLGGLAFFLFGLDQMTDALKVVAGARMRGILARVTQNRFKGLMAGAFVTAIIQSSSVTTVLLVGFITAGLMTLQQSIGVIFGANIGTTVTAQIVAFKATQYAMLLVIGGFGMQFVSKDLRVRRWGHVLLGLGMVFFGMELMSDAARPLRSYQPFIDFMEGMDSPYLGILAGAGFTALVQSSSATMGIVIVLATQGFITLEVGIALAFGANIGTCITALLAGIGKPVEAKRAAAVHILFNVVGVLLWVAFIDQLAEFCRWFSPAAAGLEGTDRLAAEVPRQVANAHTVFNLANTFLLIWFTRPFAWLVERLVREPPEQLPGKLRPKYLDDLLLDTPGIALDRVRLELGRLGTLSLRMLDAAPRAILEGSRSDLDALQKMDDDLDVLHGAVVKYLGELSQRDISKDESKELGDLLAAANYIENIGDMIETSLFEAGTERVAANVVVSEGTRTLMRAFFVRVEGLVKQALDALTDDDPIAAAAVIDAKAEVNQLALDAEAHLTARLVADAPNRLAAFRLESDVVENLKRVYYFAKRIARIVADAEKNGEERRTDTVNTDDGVAVQGAAS
jgi:phosphate:Na+ symporter